MIIYGVALLAICMLAGVVSDMLGVLLGSQISVGGVGIAMILLICTVVDYKHGGMTKECRDGCLLGCHVHPGGGGDGGATNVVTAARRPSGEDASGDWFGNWCARLHDCRDQPRKEANRCPMKSADCAAPVAGGHFDMWELIEKGLAEITAVCLCICRRGDADFGGAVKR